MGHKLGPETTRGQVLDEAAYAALVETLALTPKRTLQSLCERLDVAVVPTVNDHRHVAADVSFGPRYAGVERVEGQNLRTVYAKALALGIDVRLESVMLARTDFDAITDRIREPGLMLELERRLLGATAPGGLSSHHRPADTDTKKEGD